MKYFYGAAALLAATAVAQDNGCADASNYEGNYYCSQVDAITYTGVGGSGSYNRVTNMDSNSGDCSSTPFGYSGSLSPLDQEVGCTEINNAQFRHVSNPIAIGVPTYARPIQAFAVCSIHPRWLILEEGSTKRACTPTRSRAPPRSWHPRTPS